MEAIKPASSLPRLIAQFRLPAPQHNLRSPDLPASDEEEQPPPPQRNDNTDKQKKIQKPTFAPSIRPPTAWFFLECNVVLYRMNQT